MSGDDGWARAAALFERLVDLPPERRSDLLDEARHADAEVARMVERLLAADADQGGPLEESLESYADLAFENARLEPGTRLGDFEILGELGRGGMGLVYEARDLRLDRLAALKLLPADRILDEEDEDAASRLLAEARAASSLDHPNVATVYQVGDAPDGRRFIAMARYEGETLRERLSREPLKPNAVLNVAIQVARGLAAVHAAGIIHRDVKPENIFLTSDGPVKLLDFGISGTAGEDRTGGVAGTPTYMSPEALAGDPPDTRSDTWALGVIIDEMLNEDDDSRLATGLREFSARATADRPADRFVDGREMLGTLLARRPEISSSRRRARALGAIVLGTAAVLLAFVALRAGEQPEIGSLAVGSFDGPDARALESVLARRLAGLEGIEFIPQERLEEVRAQMVAAGVADSTDRGRIGRLAGARVLITGTVERADSVVRLHLRRDDLVRGGGSNFAELTAPSDSALLEAAVLSIADELGLSPPRGSPRRGSALADRLFEEGVRALHAGHEATARRLFAGVIAEDSLHAQAWLHLWRTRRSVEGETVDTLLGRVVEIAARLPRRDRLTLRAEWARATFDRSLVPLSDSLVRSFPSDPTSHVIRAQALALDGDAAGAVRHLRRVLTLDSLSLRGDPAICRACDALDQLVDAYDLLDSLGLALDAANEWVRWRPNSSKAWSQLAYVLEDLGREEAAIEARRRAAELAPARAMSLVYPGRAALRAGRWAEADRLLRDVVRHGHPRARRLALWWLAISLRDQGRLEEALEVERRRASLSTTRNATTESPEDGRRTPSLFEGQLLAELGLHDEAAAAFRAIERRGRKYQYRGQVARGRSWPLVHLATALAAAGDEEGLASVVDTLARLGPNSLLRRNRLGHHYARGLLLRLRGQPDTALTEFRLALTSPSNGYSRLNLELGRTLLELDRPQEAIDVLEAALPGMLESTHLYVSRAELREMLARAYLQVGRTDKAVENLRWVADAWSAADRRLARRGEAALDRLMQLTGAGA